MRWFKCRLLVFAWLAAVLLPIQTPAQVLAYVGTDSIAIEDFSQQYRDYRQQSQQGDSLQTRLDCLQQMAGEIIYARYSREAGLDQDPNIRRAGHIAWREAILHGVAHVHFMDDVSLSADEVEAEYRYRNTTLLTRYLVLRDSLAAVEYRQRIKAGEPFQSLALQAADVPIFMDNPGEPGWKFPHQLDSSYARHASRLALGQFSRPLKTRQGYLVVQMLGKEFRPDHGHFERVKYHQRIAAELRPLKVIDTAREELRQWSANLPIKWHRLAARKVLRSGVLDDPGIMSRADTTAAELADEVLFTLYDEPYSLDWLLARLYLLPPDERTDVTSVKALRELVQRLLMWDQLMELAASLPQADSLMATADGLREVVIHRAIRDSIQAQILRRAVPPEDSLRHFLAGRRKLYNTQALVNLEEIVVRDSALAAALRDTLLTDDATDFGALAQRHTERKWARMTGGRLGWVPLKIYGPAAAALVEAAGRNPERLVGPLKVDGYYVLARPSGYRPARVPSFDAIQPRLRRDWIAANRQRLIREWVQQQTAFYPVDIDTNLVTRLRLDEMGKVTLPAMPDSTTHDVNSVSPDQYPRGADPRPPD
ncbi:MAG: hypothetical protein GH143_02950 [Calditrichaeota bacterium]|nr:hypothetical protein [Calditrichota bacterium]